MTGITKVSPIPLNWITKLLWRLLAVGFKVEKLKMPKKLKGQTAKITIIDEMANLKE